MHTQSRLPNLRAHRAVLILYTILTVILSWPLIGRIFTHVPGVAQWAFDESTFVWNIWYFKHAVVDQLSSPLHSDLIYYPLGIDLILYTYNFFHALLSQPLFLATNLPFASNVSLLISTILSGYGTFLLVRYLLGNRQTPRTPNTEYRILNTEYIAPIIAGLLYAFASNRAIYAALGHYDMVTTQWIPFYALTLLRSLDQNLTGRQRAKSALLAGIFFAFNGLAEMITALFLAIFTVIVVLNHLFGASRESSLQSDEDFLPQRREGAKNSEETRHPFILLSGHPWTERGRRLVISLLLIGITAFALWSPVLVPILTQFITNDFSLKGWGEAIPLSTDLLGWFTPSALHPLWGIDLVPELRAIQLRALANDAGPVGFRDLNTVFLGWFTLGLALIGALLFWKRVRLWAWTSIIFGIFTLGPFLQINGQYRFDLDGVDATFPMPYALLHYIPIIKANRAPNRNSVILMLGLAVLAAYTINAILYKLRQPNRNFQFSIFNFQFVIALLLATLIIFEHATLPLPLSDARVPEVYAQIAEDPSEVAVMHLPLGWRNSFGTFGAERTRLQYFQTTHGKPMLGGNISRAPDFKMDYFRRLPFFNVLADIEAGHQVAPERIDAARAQANELMQFYNVGYVLFMPPIEQRFPYADTWQATWEFAKETLPLEADPFWQQDGIEAYKIAVEKVEQNDAVLADKFKLDLGPRGTFPYRAEGWDADESDEPYETGAIWATPADGMSSRLLIPLRDVDSDAEYVVTARLRPFVLPQSVDLRVNGQSLMVQPLIDDWQEITWAIPNGLLRDGINDVEFVWQRADVPRQFNPGSRQIGSTGIDLPIDVDIKAFDGGGFISFFDEAGDQTDGSAGRRGVNVTVLSDAGEVLDRVGFDTAANEFESEKLAEFLRGVEPNQPILIASSGDATAFLTESAIDALRGIGADLSLDGLRGNAFVVVGVQGAAVGSAAVVLDPNEAFLRISLNRDRRPLAAAVDWVEIKP